MELYAIIRFLKLKEKVTALIKARIVIPIKIEKGWNKQEMSMTDNAPMPEPRRLEKYVLPIGNFKSANPITQAPKKKGIPKMMKYKNRI